MRSVQSIHSSTDSSRIFGAMKILCAAFLFAVAVLSARDALAQEITQTGDLSHARAQPAATLLQDGRVLVTSGWTESGVSCPGRGNPLPDADLFDTVTESFKFVSPMNEPRWEHQQILLNDGRVLIAGGSINCVTNMTSSAELFDPSSETFTFTGSMTIPRREAPIHKLSNGNVLVFGGEKEGLFATATDRVDMFDPTTGTWTTVGHISEPKGGMGGCELADGRILLFGGRNRFDDRDPIRLNSAEIYDPATNSSVVLAAQTVHSLPRWNNGLRLQDGRCLITGAGEGGAVELFDPITETFSNVPFPPGYSPVGDGLPSAVLLPNGKAYVGWVRPMLFNPETDTLTELIGLPGMPYTGYTATGLSDGRVLIAGGRSFDNPILSSAFVFDPDFFTWPVGEFNPTAGHYGPCDEHKKDPEGCFWISGAAENDQTWRDASPFMKHLVKREKNIRRYHLGADYNLGKNDNDENLPVYPTAPGEIVGVHENVCGYGNIIFVEHDPSFGVFTSMYAHVYWLETGKPTIGQSVTSDTAIAKVGNGAWGSDCNTKNKGHYKPHLHFEIREGNNATIAPAYWDEKLTVGPQGQIDPNEFIAEH